MEEPKHFNCSCGGVPLDEAETPEQIRRRYTGLMVRDGRRVMPPTEAVNWCLALLQVGKLTGAVPSPDGIVQHTILFHYLYHPHQPFTVETLWECLRRRVGRTLAGKLIAQINRVMNPVPQQDDTEDMTL